MEQFERAKESGLSIEQERKLHIIRGCILGSFLSNEEKREMCEFINALEEYFNSDDL